jgi:hypothetical protein
MPSAKVKATSLNLREDADVTANVVAVMGQGTAVDILAPNEDDSWVMIDAVIGGQTRIGWVETQFLTLDGMTDPPPDLPAASGATNLNYPGILFTALVNGGFYSSEPDNLKILRGIRSNNPGAINNSDWQRIRPG